YFCAALSNGTSCHYILGPMQSDEPCLWTVIHQCSAENHGGLRVSDQPLQSSAPAREDDPLQQRLLHRQRQLAREESCRILQHGDRPKYHSVNQHLLRRRERLYARSSSRTTDSSPNSQQHSVSDSQLLSGHTVPWHQSNNRGWQLRG